jgi:hypothetical protein
LDETGAAVARKKTEFLWPKVIEVAKGLTERNKRRRTLKRFVDFHRKWLLTGVALSALLAVGEISKTGLGEACGRFGRWGLGIPFAVALIPAAYVVFQLALEVVFMILALPLGALAVLLGGWGRRLTWVALGGFAVWYVFAIGQAIGEGTLSKHETPAPPVTEQAASAPPVAPPLCVEPPSSPATERLLKWLQTNPVAGTFLGLLVLTVVKAMFDNLGKDLYLALKTRLVGPKPAPP